MDVADVTALLCYTDPYSSELKFILSDSQKSMIADKINNEILSKLQY
jgi:hypothetical protein